MSANVDLSPPLGYRRGLDGMRALAVLLVAGVHTHPRLIPGGSIGVDVFFVLSGFLITSLLVEELDHRGRIHFGHFYIRRLLRLLPALLALIAIVLVWATFVASPSTRHNAYMEVLASLSYTRNLTIWSHVPGTLLGHTWSLALEEQFYLLWPLVLTLCIRPREGAMRMIAIFGAIFVLFGVVRLCHVQGPSLLFVERPEALLLGSGLALFRREQSHRWVGERIRSAARAAVVLGAAGLVLLSVWNGADAMFSIGYSIAALLSVALIFGLVVLDGDGPSRWFCGRWAVRFGQMSYGFYLWHMPVLRWVDDRLGATTALLRTPIGLGLALLAAMASYRWIETPALRLKARFRVPNVVERPSEVGQTN
jgi:peptidoglycan/LPS O-acetylase OafA/YrhL